MFDQAAAIVWAQGRTTLNFYSRGNLGMLAFTVIMSALWYGMAAAGGVGAAILASDPKRIDWLEGSAPKVLIFVFLYWQVVPILLASTGASLDLKRLLVYPISHRQLFGLEVLLRFSSGIEMMLILTGAAIGILLNPALRWWGVLAFVPWIALNLFLSVGLRDLLTRLLTRRGIREISILVLLLVAAFPQLVVLQGMPQAARDVIVAFEFNYLPWAAAARLALSRFDVASLAALLGWTAVACWFGWWQFRRSLRFDQAAARSTAAATARGGFWAEKLYRIPSLLFPDPLGGVIEKEIRFLSRAPRFRIVFLMGFTFGLLIWLPLAMSGGRTSTSFVATNYLTFVTVYALMLLGEVSFWNTFGFDRSAVQIYYLVPVRFSLVLVAKNLAAFTFVLLEITAVAGVCALLNMPVTPGRLVEAYVVTLVMTLFLMAVGNLGSVYYPRPVNPVQSWRSAAAGRFQALLLLLYPLVSIPIVLAYLARFAFDSQAAFYGVLAFGAALGCAFYWVAMESAVSAAEQRKEAIVTALSQTEGPMTT